MRVDRHGHRRGEDRRGRGARRERRSAASTAGRGLADRERRPRRSCPSPSAVSTWLRAAARWMPMPDFGAISITFVPSNRRPPSTSPLPVCATQASSTASNRPGSTLTTNGMWSGRNRRSTAPVSWLIGLRLRPAFARRADARRRVDVQPDRRRVDRRARSSRRCTWIGWCSSLRRARLRPRRAPPSPTSRSRRRRRSRRPACTSTALDDRAP